ncbi:13824_t:CDS:2 [Racocetra persica]|uniref:13824_t:CDS:1 n=1 Tax=Racocetra persica TaxID=160502 RepID=A0ACA9KL95_9GLOM|nr:13824_t:CDS:2 [Racocetra persica]
MSQSDINQIDIQELKSYDPDLFFDTTTSLSKYVEFYKIRFEEMNRIEANSKLVRNRNNSNFNKATNFKEKILRSPMYGMRQERDYVIDACDKCANLLMDPKDFDEILSDSSPKSSYGSDQIYYESDANEFVIRDRFNDNELTIDDSSSSQYHAAKETYSLLQQEEAQFLSWSNAIKSIFENGISNYKSGHNFENIVRKIAETNGLLASEIKVTQGNNSIDIIVTYKEKLILIQYKNVETPVNVHIVRVFESALSRFSSDSLGLIVYNSEKLNENFATSKAKNWAFTSKKNIKICNEKEFVEIIKNFFENDNDDHIELINYIADSFDLIKLVEKNVSFLSNADYIILDRTQMDMREKEYIDRKRKRARLGELVDKEYLETLNTHYIVNNDSLYPGNLKFENMVNLCDDCKKSLPCHENCDKIYENFFATLL